SARWQGSPARRSPDAGRSRSAPNQAPHLTEPASWFSELQRPCRRPRQLNSARGPAATPREGTGKAAEGGLNGGRHSRERDWSRVERECPDAPARSPLKPVLGPEIHPSDGKHILSYRGRGLQWPLRQWCFSP